MITFYTVISQFCAYPKTDDIFTDFFNFLQEYYPVVWDGLNQFYADEYDCASEAVVYAEGPYPYNPRLGLYGWDEMITRNQFDIFLESFRRYWITFSSQDFGICPGCKKETDLKLYHGPIVSYEYAPLFQTNQAYEMDGSVQVEQLVCRECSMKALKQIAEMVNIGEETCWV